MEENNSTELEEGEASSYREEEEDANNNIDPDTAFAYLVRAYSYNCCQKKKSCL